MVQIRPTSNTAVISLKDNETILLPYNNTRCIRKGTKTVPIHNRSTESHHIAPILDMPVIQTMVQQHTFCACVGNYS